MVINLFGALASVALLNYVGRQNQSIILRVLFSLWVFGPFLTYSLAMRFLKSHGGIQRTMLIITVTSVAVYAIDAILMPAKPAAPFVAIPPLACLLLAITVAAGANSR